MRRHGEQRAHGSVVQRQDEVLAEVGAAPAQDEPEDQRHQRHVGNHQLEPVGVVSRRELRLEHLRRRGGNPTHHLQVPPFRCDGRAPRGRLPPVRVHAADDFHRLRVELLAYPDLEERRLHDADEEEVEDVDAHEEAEGLLVPLASPRQVLAGEGAGAPEKGQRPKEPAVDPEQVLQQLPQELSGRLAQRPLLLPSTLLAIRPGASQSRSEIAAARRFRRPDQSAPRSPRHPAMTARASGPTGDTPDAPVAPSLATRLAAAGLDWIVPDWAAPAEVGALSTTRLGGVSVGAGGRHESRTRGCDPVRHRYAGGGHAEPAHARCLPAVIARLARAGARRQRCRARRGVRRGRARAAAGSRRRGHARAWHRLRRAHRRLPAGAVRRSPRPGRRHRPCRMAGPRGRRDRSDRGGARQRGRARPRSLRLARSGDRAARVRGRPRRAGRVRRRRRRRRRRASRRAAATNGMPISTPSHVGHSPRPACARWAAAPSARGRTRPGSIRTAAIAPPGAWPRSSGCNRVTPRQRYNAQRRQRRPPSVAR